MQKYMLNNIEFSASNNTDTLYYHQTMNDPDEKEFQKEIIK